MQHNFFEDLAKSKQDSRNPEWEQLYREVLPLYVSSSLHDEDPIAQAQGIDRKILLANGKIITVDEKFRERDFGDIALEEWSSEGKKGWIEKPLQVDYVAYIVKDSKRMYFLPFTQLQAAWIKHKTEWKKKYRKVEAKNSTYTSVCWAIPTVTLFAALFQTCVVNWVVQLLNKEIW